MQDCINDHKKTRPDINISGRVITISFVYDLEFKIYLGGKLLDVRILISHEICSFEHHR